MTGGKHTRRRRRGRDQRILVRAVRRDPIDVQKLSRAVLALVRAQAEAEAQAAHEAEKSPKEPSP